MPLYAYYTSFLSRCQSVQCDGFTIEIYDSKEKKNAVDIIHAAVGYEFLENDIRETEQLAKDYIDGKKLELREIMEEYYGNE